MKRMNRSARRVGQRGQGMTEYIIIVALIAIASITVVSFFGSTVRNQTAGMANELSGKSASESIGNAQEAAKEAHIDAMYEKNMQSYNNSVSEE